MRTSATGTSISSRPRARGFTLVEILVVVVIIGVLAVGAVLAIGVGGGNRDVTEERDRLGALIDYTRERAELENREYGLRFYRTDKTGTFYGYEIVVFDDRAGQWVRLADDRVMRGRRLPPSLEVLLAVEGRRIVLPEVKSGREKAQPEDLAPQVMLYSSGELNAFELTIQRRNSPLGFRITPREQDESLAVTDLPVATG